MSNGTLRATGINKGGGGTRTALPAPTHPPPNLLPSPLIAIQMLQVAKGSKYSSGILMRLPGK